MLCRSRKTHCKCIFIIVLLAFKTSEELTCLRMRKVYAGMRLSSTVTCQCSPYGLTSGSTTAHQARLAAHGMAGGELGSAARALRRSRSAESSCTALPRYGCSLCAVVFAEHHMAERHWGAPRALRRSRSAESSCTALPRGGASLRAASLALRRRSARNCACHSLMSDSPPTR